MIKETNMLEYNIDKNNIREGRSLTPTVNRQSLPFHACGIGSWDTGDKYFTRRDGREDYLIFLTRNGTGKLSYKGQSCILTPNSAVVIDCRLFHEYRTVPGERWQFDFLHFHALSMTGYYSTLLESLTPVRLRAPEQTSQMFLELYGLFEQNSIAADAAVSHLISGILTEMVCSVADSADSSRAISRRDIASLAEFIRNHYAEDLHIDDFIQITNLSRHYLIHLFERQIGMSPYRYLHMCRIQQAQRLLASTDRSISEIAYSVGYSSPSGFIRHFKSFLGVSPGAYRSNSVCMP
ncbi:MAG: helix-turn-helix transcriptional regulator [Clostridia bacterium]|nr:helix-turn-helix transcriptional regulator [Clostridia bacterium]